MVSLPESGAGAAVALAAWIFLDPSPCGPFSSPPSGACFLDPGVSWPHFPASCRVVFPSSLSLPSLEKPRMFLNSEAAAYTLAPVALALRLPQHCGAEWLGPFATLGGLSAGGRCHTAGRGVAVPGLLNEAFLGVRACGKCEAPRSPCWETLRRVDFQATEWCQGGHFPGGQGPSQQRPLPSWWLQPSLLGL